MKKLTQILAATALTAFASQNSAQALSISLSASAPSSDVAISSDTNPTYTSDSFTRSYRAIGQTFTTTSAFTLSSVTLLVGTTGGDLTSATWSLYIGSGTTILDTETVSPGVNYASTAAGQYMTFTLSAPYSLAAGTSYGFGVGSSLSSSNYLQYKESTSNVYSGGTAYYLNGGTATPTAHDLTFYLGSSPVPEPSSWALVPVLGTLVFLGFRRFKAQAAI